MSTTQSASQRLAASECPSDAESDLMTWAQDALGKMMLSPDDTDQVALTMEIEVAEEPGTAAEADEAGTDSESFLSRIDREYIKLLVMLGFRDEAARLVEQAHQVRSKNHSTAASEDSPLFTIYDLEYLELLLIVGRREKAVGMVLHLMDEYEVNVLTKIVRAHENQNRLEEEYHSIMTAIDTEGFLPPEEPEPETPSSRPTSFLGRLFGAFIPGRR